MSTGSVRLESRGALALLTIADEALVSEIGAIFATADAKAGIEAYLRGDLAGVSFVGA
jgi:hypothetical protein